jgi:hypothetical protein
VPGERRNSWSFLAFQLGSATFAFSTYLSMYAFRKPFAAATYAEDDFFGLDSKTVFVLSQLLGYTLSKYIGVKIVSEAGRPRRLHLLLGLVGLAELALLGFASAPSFLRPLCLFCNGLPLGMVWGLVVRYLEGRRTSEFLLSALSCSFIVGSGVVKDVGRMLLQHGVSETWMPALTGALFMLPFALSAWLLDRCPDPDPEDLQLREPRLPMGSVERRAFLRRFMPGIAGLLLVYLLLTAYRDFRDNYGVEIFAELGHGSATALFTRTELPVALLVLLSLGLLGAFQGRIAGLVSVFVAAGSGLCLVGITTWGFDRGVISGESWMIGVGLGTYLAYVPFSSFLFDRIMAAVRVTGTAVFLVNVADAVGYTGSFGMQLYKDLGHAELSRLEFFRGLSYALAGVGSVVLALVAVYFLRSARERSETVPVQASR